MYTSSDLFDLVHSLSQSERRNFSIICKQFKGKNNNLRLFEALQNQKTFDEKSLKQGFKGQALLNNFSVAKAYLYQSILDSLRQGYTRKSVEMELREMLDHFEILHQRGLISQAFKCLKKARKKAAKFELPGISARLDRYERKIVNLKSGTTVLQLLQQLEKKESDSLQKQQQEGILSSISTQIRTIYLNQIDLRDTEIAKLVDQLMSHPLLKGPVDELSYFARTYYFSTHAIYQRMMGHSLESRHFYGLLVQEWESKPHFIQRSPSDYLVALTAFLDLSLRANLYLGFQEKVQKIHLIPIKDRRLKARAFYLGHHLDLRFAISTGNFTPGLQLIPHIESGLTAHKAHLTRSIELTFLFNLGILQFLALNFSRAIHFTNRILNQSSHQVRQDIVDATRCIELVCQFELCQMELLESLLRSMERRLRLNPRQYAFERLLVRALRKLMDAPSSRNGKILLQLKADFESMKGASFLVGREELLLWIRYRIEKIIPEKLLRIQNAMESRE